MSVTLIITNTTATPPTNQQVVLPWQPNTNIQQLLEMAYSQVIFAVQYYGALGYLVVMVNSIWEDIAAPTNANWWLLINGASASGGIDAYIVQDGDTITLEYEVANPAKHGTGINLLKQQAKSGTVQ
jgi:hypothetical protein